MFFQAQETVLSAIGGCSVSKVFFLRRVRCGIRLRPAGLRRDKVYRQITCMRHRSLNNFHKNGTITIFQKHLFFEKLWDICVFAPQKKCFVHAPQVEKNPTACILMETSPGMVFRLHHLSAGTGNTAKKSWNIMDKIKVGVIGLGRAGFGMHVSEMKTFSDMFEITAVCDVDLKRAKAMKECISPEIRCYRKHLELIEDPGVELVAIACRSVEHTQYALEALRKGKYVVLDKPIALTYADARKLLAASRKYPGKLFCRQNRRFEPEFNHVMQIMESGVLGNIYMIRHSVFSFQRRNDWQTILRFGGGQLNNWGPHLIDHAVQLMGSKIKDVTGILRRVTAVGDAEDYFKILLTGRNGRVVDVEFSGGAALKSNVYEVHGDRGSLILPSDPGAQFRLKYLDPDYPLENIKADPGTPAISINQWEPYRNPEVLHWIEKTFPVNPDTDDNISTIYRHVYNAIRKGIPYRVKTEEAVEVVRVTELVREQNPAFRLPRLSHMGM